MEKTYEQWKVRPKTMKKQMPTEIFKILKKQYMREKYESR